MTRQRLEGLTKRILPLTLGVWMVAPLGVARLQAAAQEGTAPQAPATQALASGAQSTGSTTGSTVPRLVTFSGAVKDATGKIQTGAATLTFSLYEHQEGGSPLWVETQTADLDVLEHRSTLRRYRGATRRLGPASTKDRYRTHAYAIPSPF